MFTDGTTSLINNTLRLNNELPLLEPDIVNDLLGDVLTMATNIDLTNLNLTSTANFLDFVNKYLNKTTVLDAIGSLGLSECVSLTNQLFNAQSDVLNGNSIARLQSELTSFYSSYEAFMNSSSLPKSLKDGEENTTCVSSLASFPALVNNLTALVTFTSTENFAGNVISLKESLQSLQPGNNKDDLGNCNWPLKYSIWKIPNNGLFQCGNSSEDATGNVQDVVDDVQMGLLKDLSKTVTSITNTIIPANVLDECTTKSLMDATTTCNNESNVVLTDALNLLTKTLSTIKNVNASIIGPLTESLEAATNRNLSFSKYKFAEDFMKTTGNMTALVSDLKTVETLMQKVNLAMIGNVANLVPKLYYGLDKFKLIPLEQTDLINLSLFSSLTNGTGVTSLEEGLSDVVSGITDTLETVSTEMKAITGSLGEAVSQLTSNLNAYLNNFESEASFYR